MVAKKGTSFLPEPLEHAHEFCFLTHDVLVEMLRAGEQDGAFTLRVSLREGEDGTALAEAPHVLEWLAETGRTDQRNEVIRRAVFPALLSDFLHFIYEALEASRKAKLNVTYALIRKPIQESLFVFEQMAIDRERFVTDLEQDPTRLHSQTAGGVDIHAARITRALDVIDEGGRFDANYLAQLRYDKSADDSFDGVSNKALHLFTKHKAIRTEPQNINFIFSDWDSKLAQWAYLYSRLPYVLTYARRLIEHLCSQFATTDPKYLAMVERRLGATAILWARGIEPEYRYPALEPFVEATMARLKALCEAEGWGDLQVSDLERLDGSWSPKRGWRRALRRAAARLGRLRNRIKQKDQATRSV